MEKKGAARDREMDWRRRKKGTNERNDMQNPGKTKIQTNRSITERKASKITHTEGNSQANGQGIISVFICRQNQGSRRFVLTKLSFLTFLSPQAKI